MSEEEVFNIVNSGSSIPLDYKKDYIIEVYSYFKDYSFNYLTIGQDNINFNYTNNTTVNFKLDTYQEEDIKLVEKRKISNVKELLVIILTNCFIKIKVRNFCECKSK